MDPDLRRRSEELAAQLSGAAHPTAPPAPSPRAHPFWRRFDFIGALAGLVIGTVLLILHRSGGNVILGVSILVSSLYGIFHWHEHRNDGK